MLFLSRKYESFNETFWYNNQPAFDPEKKKLKSVSLEYQGPLIVRFEEIASHINELSKPIYTQIDKFYNCFRNILKINELFGAKSKKLINVELFLLAFKPSLCELEKKIWAIHVSDYLWPDAIIKPFFKEIGSQKHANGISLTIHFSLGEMVRPHSKIHHWKYCQVAVLTPLKELKKQLIPK